MNGVRNSVCNGVTHGVSNGVCRNVQNQNQIQTVLKAVCGVSNSKSIHLTVTYGGVMDERLRRESRWSR